MLLAFTVGLTPVADGDIWWHLAAGREILNSRAFLRSDVFSSGAAGRPWTDLHWLFQVGAHALHALGGLRALVLTKAALVAAGAVGLAWVVGRREAAPGGSSGREERAVGLWLFTIVMVAALFCARHLLLVRPVILTLLFLVAFFAVLEEFRRTQSRRVLVALPLLQIVWANCQGLFALGPVVVLHFAVGAWITWLAERRGASTRTFVREPGVGPLLVVLLACAAASLVTPYGLRALTLALEIATRITPSAGNPYSSEIAENIPPWILERTQPGLFWHLRWFLILLGASFVAGRRRLVATHVFLCLSFTALALGANRNILLLYWLGVPILVMNLAPTVAVWARRLAGSDRPSPTGPPEPPELPRHQGRHRPWLAWAGRALAPMTLAALAVVIATTLRREPTLAAPTPFRVPAGSAAVLAQREGTGAIFCADHYGGYLTWTLFPRFRPFIDTRHILRTRAELQEFLGLLDEPPRFDAFQAARHFAYAVLPVAFPERYLGLIQHLGRSPDWKLLYTDGQEVLFGYQADGPALDLSLRTVTEHLLASCGTRFGTDADLRGSCAVQIAMLDLTLGHVNEARYVLADQPGRSARTLLARVELVGGQIAEAEMLTRSLLGSDDRDPDAWALLAAIALSRGARPEAIGHLRRALELDPYNATALDLLTELEGGK